MEFSLLERRALIAGQRAGGYLTAKRSDDLKPGAFTAFTNTLAQGAASCAIQVLGDSTGWTNVRWPYLLGQRLAAKFPNYGVQWVQFNDATQAYDAPVIIQAPPLGNRYVNVTAGSASHPGDGSTLTGLDIIAHDVTFTAWSSAGNPVIVAKDASGSNRQFRFVNSQGSGKIALQWSIDGTSLITKESTVAAPITFGTPIALRVQHVWNDGAGNNTVKFFTSTDDGTTWTQLGTTLTTAGTIAGYFNAVANYEIGAYSNNSNPFTGKIGRVEVRNGVNGPMVTPMYPDNWGLWTSGISLGGSPMITILNGSKPGANISYLNDSVRAPKMLLKGYGTQVVILSESHNDVTLISDPFLSQWDTWLSRVRAAHPYAPVAVGLQNPRIAPADNIDAHRFRQTSLIQWANSKGFGLVNVFDAFNKDSRGLAALVQAVDGVHPTDAAGSPLWADTYVAAMPGLPA